VTAVLAVLVGVLFAAGTYLLLQRTLTRVIFGIAVLGHGANLLLLLAGGRAGDPPLLTGSGETRRLVGASGGAGFVDPLPQALALTAIVISFGAVAFLLTLAYRSWLLHGEDEVTDDVEDRRIARLAERKEAGS
jgi:multicomponent Na+:H+ antiporter subunit C